MTTTVTTLPDIEVVDLPGLDAEVPCTILVDGVPCGVPARWRVVVTCSGCGARTQDAVSVPCRAALFAAGFPDAFTTDCCRQPYSDVRWDRL